jgi:CMP/dCMP kinase
LARRGEKIDYNSILEDIKRRDARDSERAAAPLRPADDAVRLDTTPLGVEAAFVEALRVVEAARVKA